MSEPVPTPSAPPALPSHPKVGTAFVLSLLSLIIFAPLAIISFVQVKGIRRDMAAQPGTWNEDDGQLKSAWVMSIIGLVFCALLVIWVAAAIILLSSGATVAS